MSSVEGGVFSAREIGTSVDALAGGVPANREFVLAVAETGLVAAVGGVEGAEVSRQYRAAAMVAGGGFEVGLDAGVQRARIGVAGDRRRAVAARDEGGGRILGEGQPKYLNSPESRSSSARS